MADTARPMGELKSEFGHPVIDVDGHVQEYMPAVEPYLRDGLGTALFDDWTVLHGSVAAANGRPDAAERRRTRTPQGNWWGTPARNTRDLATAVLPALLHERLDDFGIDFSVLYPSKGLGVTAIHDTEMRRGVCRGFNEFYAATYGPYADRMTVAGIIPTQTPDEAVAEIEHCVALGLKVVALAEGVLRPMAPGGASPALLPGQDLWLDTYGLDSEYDYDTVWQTCARLGLPVTFHAGLGTLAPSVAPSITNYTANHVGRFAERMSVVCKSLLMGGVTHRFPEVRFAFLECGVGWAAILLSDLVEHHEKRNIGHLRTHLDPALIDWEELGRYMQDYGAALVSGGDLEAGMRQIPAVGAVPECMDDWAAAGIASEEDVVARFVPHFFFGCEADDPTTAFAFAPGNPGGARLRPVFSSDIGHWDVTEMDGVVREAAGLVRRGLLSATDFEEFVFANPVDLLAGSNPDFFADTPIRRQVEAEISRHTPTPERSRRATDQENSDA